MNNAVAGFKTAQSHAFALAKAGAFSSQLNAALRESEVSEVAPVTLKQHTLFARLHVGNKGGTFRFVDNLTEKRPGVCNFDQGRLAPNEAMIISKLSVGYGTGADANSAGAIAFGAVAPPAVIRNSELVIRQGKRVVLALPISDLVNPNPDLATKESDNWTELQNLFYKNDQESFIWEIETPDGEIIPAGAAGANFPYLEIRVGGHITGLRGL